MIQSTSVVVGKTSRRIHLIITIVDNVVSAEQYWPTNPTCTTRILYNKLELFTSCKNCYDLFLCNIMNLKKQTLNAECRSEYQQCITRILKLKVHKDFSLHTVA